MPAASVEDGSVSDVGALAVIAAAGELCPRSRKETTVELNASSPERRAAQHVLQAPTVWRRSAVYVGTEDIDWARLLDEAETMSGGEALLVRVAHDFWHLERSVGLCEVPRRLGQRNLERVLDAMRMCHGAAAAIPAPEGAARRALVKDRPVPAS